MDTIEINFYMASLLSKTNCRWLGVFSSDKFPSLSMHASYPLAFVCNSDKANTPGTHWLAFYFLSFNNCEFFDSFAMPISSYSFSLPENLQVTLSLTMPIQSAISNLCGYYCIYYLYNRALNHSSLNIARSFSQIYYKNDRLVHKFMSRLGFHPHIHPYFPISN